MPIPMSNMEKNIQTPNTAKGQALNLSKEAATSVAMAQDFANTITKGLIGTADAVTSYMKQRQDQKEMTLANEAYNSYMEKMEQLNATMSQKRGAQAIDFQKDYEELAQKYHREFYSVIDGLNNSKIRENYREHVNSFNRKNQANSFSYFDNERKQYLQVTTDAASKNEIANARQNFVNGSFENNLKQAYDLFVKLDANEEAIAATKGYTIIPGNEKLSSEVSQYLQLAKQTRRQLAVNEITRDLDEKNTDLRPWKSSASSIQLVKDLAASGAINADYANAKLKELEANQFQVELKRRPQQFWDPYSGRFLSENRKKNCPHLTQEEYEHAAQKITSRGSGSVSADKEIQDDSLSYLYNILMQNGVGSTASGMIKSLGIDEDTHNSYVDTSRANYKDGETDLNNLQNMYRLVDAISRSKVVIHQDGTFAEVGNNVNQDLLPKGDKLVNMINPDSVKSTKQALQALINKNIEAGDYNIALRTKLLTNNRPTMSQVASGITGSFLHDIQNVSWWQKTKRFILQDRSKIPNLGPIKTPQIATAMMAGMEARLKQYGIDPNTIENDRYNDYVVYQKDQSGNNIVGTDVSIQELADLGMAEGLVNYLGADDALALFGTDKNGIKNMISASRRDFQAQMNSKVAKWNFNTMLGFASQNPIKLAKGFYDIASDAYTISKGAIEAKSTNQELNEFAQNTTSAVRANSARLLEEFNSDGVNIPQALTDASDMIEQILPYPRESKESFAKMVHEKLWGDVQYLETPDYDTYSSDMQGNPESYKEYLNNQIENDRLFNKLQEDGVFDKVENKLALYKSEGNFSDALSKRYSDYLSGSGVYSPNIRNRRQAKNEPIDVLGNVLTQQKQNELWELDYSQREKAKAWLQVQPKKQIDKSKLYFVSPNKQYYFDKNGIVHEYNLPSNQVFATLMLMKGKDYSAVTNKRSMVNIDLGQQYVDGGAFRQSLNSDVRNTILNRDFTFD